MVEHGSPAELRARQVVGLPRGPGGRRPVPGPGSGRGRGVPVRLQSRILGRVPAELGQAGVRIGVERIGISLGGIEPGAGRVPAGCALARVGVAGLVPVRPGLRRDGRGPGGAVVRRLVGGHVAGAGGGLEQADDRLVVGAGQHLRADLELERGDPGQDAAGPVRIRGQGEHRRRGGRAAAVRVGGDQRGDTARLSRDVGQERELRLVRRDIADQQGQRPVLIVRLGDPAVADVDRAAVAEPGAAA